MSNPIPDLVRFLRGHGIPVVDKRVPGRGGTFSPCGLMVHHTASPEGSGDVPSLGTVTKGRPDVPGPLSQMLLGRAGTVVVVTDGRANHPGKVHGPTIDRLRQGLPQTANPNRCDGGDTPKVNASSYLWGIEAENNGLGEPWPKVQLERYLQICEAFCRELGWDPWVNVISHKKATRRKIDPSFDMRWFLDELARRLDTATHTLISTHEEPEDDMPQWSEWKPEERKGLLDDIYLRLVPTLTGSQIASVDDPVTNLGTLYNRTSEILGAISLVQAGGGQVDIDALASKVKDGLGADVAKALGEKLISS